MSRCAPSLPAVWAVTVLPVVAVAAGCLWAFGSDAGTAAYFVSWRAAHAEAVRWLVLYTDWGNPALYLAYAGILAFGLARRRRGPTAFVLAYLVGQILVSVILVHAVKIGFGRPRPMVGGRWIPFSLDDAHNSMPSGHTEEMTLQTATLAGLHRRIAPAAALLLGLMGASRIILGAHNPSDVLAAAGLGLCGAALVRRLIPRLAARLPRHWSA